MEKAYNWKLLGSYPKKIKETFRGEIMMSIYKSQDGKEKSLALYMALQKLPVSCKKSFTLDKAHYFYLASYFRRIYLKFS